MWIWIDITFNFKTYEYTKVSESYLIYLIATSVQKYSIYNYVKNLINVWEKM